MPSTTAPPVPEHHPGRAASAGFAAANAITAEINAAYHDLTTSPHLCRPVGCRQPGFGSALGAAVGSVLGLAVSHTFLAVLRYAERFSRVRDGHLSSMSLLLVDDRDGCVLAEVRTPEQMQRLLERLWGDEDVPEYLCLVECHSHHGAIIGTDTTVKVRPL